MSIKNLLDKPPMINLYFNTKVGLNNFFRVYLIYVTKMLPINQIHGKIIVNISF